MCQGRTAGKERFTRFYDLLDEVLASHRVVRVLDTDELSELGREAIAEEACKLVVPAFRRFVQRMKDREFSKSKYCIMLGTLANQFSQILRNVSNKERKKKSIYFTFFLTTLDIKMSPDEVEAKLKSIFN